MIPKLESAEYVEGHAIHVRFADGTEGDIHLEADLAPEFLYEKAAEQADAAGRPSAGH